jgi:hypothetical protein
MIRAAYPIRLKMENAVSLLGFAEGCCTGLFKDAA